MVFWEEYLSDETMGTFSPIVVYWVYAGAYHLLPPLEKFRLHTRVEKKQKNVVELPEVIRGVIVQQTFQAIVAQLLFFLTKQSNASLTAKPIQPPIKIQLLQFAAAMFIMDSWQYFTHRYMHQNHFLYRHIHSQHHKLIVPFAFGALYNHPLEGLLLDTVGGCISFLITGMTPRTAVSFFCFATIKTVDDHCGLLISGNPLQVFFENNTAYHDIHHQLHGLKFNYSQPFFSFWDRILGTYMPFDLVKRPNGEGFEARSRKLRENQ